MDKQFLTVQEGARFSPAVVYLGQLIRTLRSISPGKDEFIKHMTKATDGKQFTKAEAERLWAAMHSVTYYMDGNLLTGLDDKHHLTFCGKVYKNFSNFFEDYAKSIIDEGNIFQTRGRVKGKVYADTQAHIAAMCAAKAAKKANQEEAPVLEPVVNEAISLEQQIAEIDGQIAELQSKRDDLQKKLDARNQLNLICETADMTPNQLSDLINLVLNS